MRNRVEEIKSKGFNIIQGRQDIEYLENAGVFGKSNTEFSKIRIGVKNLDDAILDLGDYKKINPRLANKQTVLKAIDDGDLNEKNCTSWSKRLHWSSDN